MENPRLLCHYIKRGVPEEKVEKMLNEFRNQGWMFISLISISGHNHEGYFFQKNS
ncbi:MAG: hypothetical protein ACTSXK_06245 [Promethearchaeota archaeon]